MSPAIIHNPTNEQMSLDLLHVLATSTLDPETEQHPAAELLCYMHEQGYGIIRLEPALLADQLWNAFERMTVTEQTAHRFAEDHELVPLHLEHTIERIERAGRVDFDQLVRDFVLSPVQLVRADA